MSKFSKIFTVFIILLTGFFVFDKFGSGMTGFISGFGGFSLPKIAKNEIKADIIDPPEMIPSKTATDIDAPKTQAEQAYIFFLTLDKNGNSVYKKVKRTVPQGEDKFVFALNSLLKGPDIPEKALGTYSEIPMTSKLNKIKISGNKITVDISADFATGGGTDSIYSRMMQLIKTATANADGKKVYLYSEGSKVNTIGGEGIMISQPLSEKSLDG